MCSHLFSGGGFGSILGDVLGAVGGFLVGGPAGAAIGGGLGGAVGNAAGGGKGLGSDVLAGLGGAALGFGGGELASGLGATSLTGLDGGSGGLGGLFGGSSAPAGTAGTISPAAQAAGASGTTLLGNPLPSAVDPALVASDGSTIVPPIPPDIANASAAGGATAAAGSTGGTGSGFLDALIPGKGSVLPAAIAGTGLLLNMTKNQSLPGTSQLNSAATQALSQSAQLQSYLGSGTLPPGVQAGIDQATQSAVAAAKAKFAQLGESGSTMETQEIATIQQTAAAQAGSVATQLLQTGISEAQLPASIYQFLVQTNQQQNTQTGQSISNLAAALAGGVNTKAGTFIPAAA